MLDLIDNAFIQFYSGTYMCNRSRITDIISFYNYIIVLTKKGACLVYNATTYNRHMFLNPSKFDYVQTVFVNRLNDELLMVTYRQYENSNVLECRSIPLRYLPPLSLTVVLSVPVI